MMNRWLPLMAVFLLLIPAGLFAKDKKDKNKGPEQVSVLKFQVLKADNGKPVRNAAVVLHPVDSDGSQSRGGFELKTDADGKTETDGIPYGKLRVQIIAPGFQTFGQDYQIAQPQQVLTIRLKRPQGQYSIYENNTGKVDQSGQSSQGQGNQNSPPPK